MTLTQLAGGFEKLLSRLPGAIRKPVENEWRPLQELFLRRRAARVLVISQPGAGVEAWVREVFQMAQGETEAGVGVWSTYHHRGKLEFAIAEKETEAQAAILSAQPDVFLYLSGTKGADLSLLASLHGFAQERHAKSVPIVAAGPEPLGLLEALNRESALRGAVNAVLEQNRREAILAAIAQVLPLDARLEFARVSGEKTAQVEIAALLTRSATAVCTAIGTQPIPLADFPVLTSIQVLMVAGIIHATGREWGVKLARDFLAALGVNLGLGFLLREGSRAAWKFLPGWGNAISGAIAGAGTYAVGRAATAYFIEGLPMTEARRRFKFFNRKKKPPQLPE